MTVPVLQKGDELKGAVFKSDREAKIRENVQSVGAAVDAIKSLDLLISDKDYAGVRCISMNNILRSTTL